MDELIRRLRHGGPRWKVTITTTNEEGQQQISESATVQAPNQLTAAATAFIVELDHIEPAAFDTTTITIERAGLRH